MEARQIVGDSGDFETRFEDLYSRYKERLMRVVRWRLWRGQSSDESVVQDVLLSYAGHLRQPQTGNLKEDELWRLLFRIALRHCNNKNHVTSRAGEREDPGAFQPAARQEG